MPDYQVARWNAPNKHLALASYRPFVELDCPFCKWLASGEFAPLCSLKVADVGVAGGFDPRWDLFGDRCIMIGFEPDKAECEKLKAAIDAEGTSHRKSVAEVALWSSRQTKLLYVTKDPDATSFYPPDMSFFSRLPDPSPNSVVRTVNVTTTTLDAYSDELKVGPIDVVKMDVQGAELDVLKGAQTQIRRGMLAVIAETMFDRQYIDQPLFADLDSFLRANGFRLFDIDLRRWRRRRLPLCFDGIRIGQTVYANVLYLKDPIAAWPSFCDPELERQQLVKLCALAEFFSLPDYSLELLDFAAGRGLISPREGKEITALLLRNNLVAFNNRNRMPPPQAVPMSAAAG